MINRGDNLYPYQSGLRIGQDFGEILRIAVL